MSALIIDIETTGVPKFNYKDWTECYAVQIAYIIISKDYNILTSKNYYIKDLEHKSFSYAYKIHHIDEDFRNSKGISIIDFMNEYKHDIKKYNIKVIVSHGIEFDIGLLIQECIRNGIDYKFMKNITYCNTKLSNLYVKDRGLEYSVRKNNIKIEYNGTAHDALYDTYLCYYLFKNSKKKSLIVSFESLY